MWEKIHSDEIAFIFPILWLLGEVKDSTLSNFEFASVVWKLNILCFHLTFCSWKGCFWQKQYLLLSCGPESAVSRSQTVDSQKVVQTDWLQSDLGDNFMLTIWSVNRISAGHCIVEMYTSVSYLVKAYVALLGFRDTQETFMSCHPSLIPP